MLLLSAYYIRTRYLAYSPNFVFWSQKLICVVLWYRRNLYFLVIRKITNINTGSRSNISCWYNSSLSTKLLVSYHKWAKESKKSLKLTVASMRGKRLTTSRTRKPPMERKTLLIHHFKNEKGSGAETVSCIGKFHFLFAPWETTWHHCSPIIP